MDAPRGATRRVCGRRRAARRRRLIQMGTSSRDAASLAKALDQAARCGDDRLMDTVLQGLNMTSSRRRFETAEASALPL